jgi:peptide-methionine (S)-S-oxide reductase
LQVIFDPDKVSYRQLLEFFYKMHDPTTADRQGPDMGSQYRSAIFFHDPEQEKTAKDVTEKANKQWYKGKIVTEIIPAGEWYDAETYHQVCPKVHSSRIPANILTSCTSTKTQEATNVLHIS